MNKKGSILLWTMFVSLFIVSFFVAYQSGILSAIKSSGNKGNIINNNSSLDSYFSSLKGNPKESSEIGDYKISSLDSSDYLSYSGYLNYNEATEYWITLTGGTTSLDGNLVDGGPIEYNTISFNSGSANLASVYSSGYLASTGSFSITLDSSKNFNIIAVHNLGGNASYTISKGTTNILAPTNKYAIYRKFNYMYNFIGNKEITNFDKGTSGINYNNFDVFLNSSNY